MGRRGPAPKSATLKVLTGNPGHKPIQKEPQPRRGAPEPPDWLQAEARAEWDRVVPELAAVGIAQVDLAILAMYCDAWADYSRAIAAGPVDVRDRSQILTRCKLEDRLLSVIRELGMDPAARARMGAKPDAKEERSDLDEMMVQAARRGS